MKPLKSIISDPNYYMVTLDPKTYGKTAHKTLKLYYPAGEGAYYVNKNVQEAEYNTECWAKKFGMYNNVFENFKEMHFAWLIGFCYTSESFQELKIFQLLVDWLTWLLCNDDIIDRRFSKTMQVQNLQKRDERLIGIFAGTETPGTPQEHALHDLATRLSEHVISMDELVILRQSLSDHLSSTEWEAFERKHHETLHSLAAYRIMRRYTSGAPLFAHLGALLIGRPYIFRDNIIMRGMCDIACDYIGLVNDIVSYHQEQKNHLCENCITVMQHEDNQHPDIFGEIEGFLKSSVYALQGLEHLLPANLTRPEKECVSLFKNSMHGNAAWHLCTGRYNNTKKADMVRLRQYPIA